VLAALRFEVTNLTARWILLRSAIERDNWTVVRCECLTYLQYQVTEIELFIIYI
jgi:hypothetical protein